jgi:hypothetical protein
MRMSRWALLPPSSRICSCRGANVAWRSAAGAPGSRPSALPTMAECELRVGLHPAADQRHDIGMVFEEILDRAVEKRSGVSGVGRERGRVAPSGCHHCKRRITDLPSAPRRGAGLSGLRLGRGHTHPDPPHQRGRLLCRGGLWGRYSAARFGVNSSGKPLWPVSLSPSSYISKARFFTAGRAAAICSGSRSAAMPG